MSAKSGDVNRPRSEASQSASSGSTTSDSLPNQSPPNHSTPSSDSLLNPATPSSDSLPNQSHPSTPSSDSLPHLSTPSSSEAASLPGSGSLRNGQSSQSDCDHTLVPSSGDSIDLLTQMTPPPPPTGRGRSHRTRSGSDASSRSRRTSTTTTTTVITDNMPTKKRSQITPRKELRRKSLVTEYTLLMNSARNSSDDQVRALSLVLPIIALLIFTLVVAHR